MRRRQRFKPSFDNLDKRELLSTVVQTDLIAEVDQSPWMVSGQPPDGWNGGVDIPPMN